MIKQVFLRKSFGRADISIPNSYHNFEENKSNKIYEELILHKTHIQLADRVPAMEWRARRRKEQV